MEHSPSASSLQPEVASIISTTQRPLCTYSLTNSRDAVNDTHAAPTLSAAARNASFNLSLTLYLLNVTLLVVSLVVNGFVTLVYVRNRQLLRTVNNSLVVNLSLSDLLYTLIGGFEYLARFFLFSSTSTSGNSNGNFQIFVLGCSIHALNTVSVYTCVLISLFRYLSVVCPHRRVSIRSYSTFKVIGFVWSLGVALVLPPAAVFFQVHQSDQLANRTTENSDKCPALDGIRCSICPSVTFMKLYAVTVDFIIPLVAMLALYGRVYTTVRLHRLSITLPELATTEMAGTRSKRLMLAVVGVFLLTSGPLTLFVNNRAYFDVASLDDLVWLARFSRTVADPIVYAVCNAAYAQCMARWLRCHDRVAPDESHLQISHASVFDQRWCHRKLVDNQRLDDDDTATVAAMPTLSGNFARPDGDSKLSSAKTLRESLDFADSGQVLYHHQSEWCRVSVENMSVRSSIPTVLRLSRCRRQRRAPSNKSSFNSQYMFGVPTPAVDSGRSSFDLPCCDKQKQESRTGGVDLEGSCFCGVPRNVGACAAAASTFSQLPCHCAKCVRTNSVCSSFCDMPMPPGAAAAMMDATELAHQQPVVYGRRGLQRMESSSSSRQSVVSSFSQLRSARSSMSSRISHYIPTLHESSNRSSVTSSYLPTPLSTRSNSPNSAVGGEVLINANELELYNKYIGCRYGASNSYSPRIGRHGSMLYTPNVRRCNSSFGGFESHSNRFPCQQIPETYTDIQEDEEPSSCEDEYIADDDSSDKELSTSPSTQNGGGPASLQRQEWDDIESKYPRSCFSRNSSSGYRCPNQSVSSSPNEVDEEELRSSMIPSTCHSDVMSTTFNDATQAAAAEMNGRHVRAVPVRLQSVDRAVGVVLSAKRLTTRVRSAALLTHKPDTPVPPAAKPDILVQRASAKEPIRFVYEGPLPYNRGGSLQLKPTMSLLRVPGRPPPNVPQTILEEDSVSGTPPTTPPSPVGTDSPRPSSGLSRKRKNASSWIAPPIIDVASDDNHSKDIRVECPGVLVEHHS